MLKKEYKKAGLSPDKPVELAKGSDKLSFDKLVDSAIDLIKLPQPPFTFGLFGKWGTGKSTILGEIEKRLDGQDHYVVTFDAWKYEGDALRRSFLISIAKQLNKKYIDIKLLPNKKVLSDDFVEKLEENIYKDRSEPTLKNNFSWWKAIPLAAIFLLLLAAQIAIVVANPDSKLIVGVSPLILASIMGIATFVASVISPSSVNKLFVKEINIGTDKLSSPEEFHAKFLSILDEIKGKTLLVIIDNLDRTQKEVTVKLLGTIKTFLNSDSGKEDVIFLVATDHKAVKRHIKDVYANDLEDAYEAEEFIKKFFNAVIEIPSFISSEYRDYLIDLINETGIQTLADRKDDLISIVTAGYPENPRGAKHFVNSLVVYLLMLSSIGSGSGVEQDFIEKNLSFIAMMLVIRDRFDEVYDYVQEKSLKYEHSWIDIKNNIAELYTTDNASDAKRRDFRLFYNSVESWVDPSEGSLKWFFNMRRSKEEQQLANWDSFISSVDKKDHDQALKHLNEFYEQPTTLSTLLTQHIKNIRGEATRWTDFCAVFIGYLTKSNPDAALGLSGAVKQVFRYFPGANALYKFANQISFGKLIDIIDMDFTEPSEKGRVRASINEHIKSGNISEGNLLEVIGSELTKDSINASTLGAISEYTDISKDFIKSANLLQKLVELDDKCTYITHTSVSKVLQSIADQDIDDLGILDAKLAYIRAGRFTTQEIANKYMDLFNWLQNRGNKDNRSLAALYFAKFLVTSRDSTDIPPPNITQTITQYVTSWYNQSRNEHIANRNIVVLLIQLIKQEQNGYAQNARNIVQEYFGAADPESLVFVMNSVGSGQENKQLIINKINERILGNVNLFHDIDRESKDWLSNEDLSSLAMYLVSNASNLRTPESYTNAINLSADLSSRVDEDDSTFKAKLYESLDAATPKFTDAVSKYVHKKKDNLLSGHDDWLLDLKRKIRDLKATE